MIIQPFSFATLKLALAEGWRVANATRAVSIAYSLIFVLGGVLIIGGLLARGMTPFVIAALSTGVQRALDKLEEDQASGAWQAEAAPASRPGRRSPGWNSRQGTAAGNLPDTPSASGWWSTLPGILTGAAAVIAAITGLVTAFVGQQEKAPSLAQSPPAIAQPVSSASTPATSAPPPARQPAAPTLPTVVLDGPRDVSFHKYRPSTYTCLVYTSQRSVAG